MFCSRSCQSCPRRPRPSPALHKRAVPTQPPTAHNWHPGGLGAPPGCVEPPCAAWGSRPERPSQDAWCPASSNMLRAFASSSAASSITKPPDSERCTTCRDVVDGLTRTHAAGARRGHRPESRQGFRGHFSGLAGAHRSFSAVEPLSHSLRWRDPSVATGADSVCNLGRYAARFGVRGAVGQHPPAATRAGRPLWRASARLLG